MTDSMPAKEHDLFDYDAELRHYHEHLRTAIDVRSTDHVLDIGCGTGQATRDAARAAASGSALGIDISARMLTRARQLSRQEGLRNISFVQADAEVVVEQCGGCVAGDAQLAGNARGCHLPPARGRRWRRWPAR
jgi:tRNA G46 methylase TrmB